MNDTTAGPSGPSDETTTQAQRAWISVRASVLVAMDVVLAREYDPGAFPLVPLCDDAIADFMTQKALADLLDLGFAPDGWQTAFFPGEAS